MNKLYSSYIQVSTCKKSSLYCFWVWRRRFLKYTPFFFLWGPPPGPLEATCSPWTNLGPYPQRMIPTKFGWNLPTGSGEEDENVKSLRTTHDARRTTDDGRRTTDAGQKRMAIAHLSILLRWAKKKMVLVRSVTSDYYFTGKKTCNVCMIPMFCLTNVLGIYRALLSKLHKACDRSWILANVSREQSIFLIILFSLFISHSVEFVFYFFYNYSSIGAIKRPHI